MTAPRHARRLRLTPRGEKAVAVLVLLLFLALLGIVGSIDLGTTLPNDR